MYVVFFPYRTVAGTDYDFEDEFDDEFGETKEPEVSLKSLREQSKKQSLPIYMKGKTVKKNEDDDFGFDDFDMLTKPAAAKPPTGGKKGRGATPAASTRGRGRGRPKKGAAAAPQVRKSSFDFDDDLDKDGDEDEVDVEVKPPKEEPPKLPKLRLGAMLASRKEVEKNSHHRRDSNDSIEAAAATKVPRLKIKLGPKPEAKPEIPETNSDSISEAVISKNKKNLDQPQSDLHRGASVGGQEDLETEKEAKDAATNLSNEVSKPSPASSPTKKGFRIGNY